MQLNKTKRHKVFQHKLFSKVSKQTTKNGCSYRVTVKLDDGCCVERIQPFRPTENAFHTLLFRLTENVCSNFVAVIFSVRCVVCSNVTGEWTSTLLHTR